MFIILFIYGGSGLGKTHLMHAIGNEILKDNPHSKVKYVSAETFVNDYVNATRKGQMAKFEETYRNLDILLLDDVSSLVIKKVPKTSFSILLILFMIVVLKSFSLRTVYHKNSINLKSV